MQRKILLAAISLALLGAGCNPPSKTELLELGMNQDDVYAVLDELGAEDISDEMQVGTIDGSDPRSAGPLSGYMWHLERQNITIETKFGDGKLTTLNVWDWSDQKLSSYHHTLRFDEVSKLRIGPGTRFKTTVIKTHNPN